MYNQRRTGGEPAIERSVDEHESYRLASFTTTNDVFQPLHGGAKPFPIASNTFIVLFRGWGGENGRGPSVLLELEDVDSVAVKQAQEEPSDTGNPRILTRYGKGGAFTYRDEEKTERKEAKQMINAAFEGYDPWNSERVVCSSERIPMLSTELWVS